MVQLVIEALVQSIDVLEAVNKYVIQAVVKACHQDVIHAVIKAVIQAVIEAVVSNDMTCKKKLYF